MLALVDFKRKSVTGSVRAKAKRRPCYKMIGLALQVNSERNNLTVFIIYRIFLKVIVGRESMLTATSLTAAGGRIRENELAQ